LSKQEVGGFPDMTFQRIKSPKIPTILNPDLNKNPGNLPTRDLAVEAWVHYPAFASPNWEMRPTNRP